MNYHRPPSPLTPRKLVKDLILVNIHKDVASAEHINILMGLLKDPSLKSSVRATIGNIINRYYVEMTKLKAQVEGHREQNLDAMGLTSGDSPIVNILSIPTERLEKFLSDGDGAVDAIFEVAPDVEDTEVSQVSEDFLKLQTGNTPKQGVKVIDGLFVGDKHSAHLRNDWAVLHACKTFHKAKLGYSGNLDSSDSRYLFFEEGSEGWINMIDSKKPLFRYECFHFGMKFIKKNLKRFNVLVHCDQGRSRAPSVVLCYLAWTGQITKKSYREARDEFVKLYKDYDPGQGIATWLSEKVNWEQVMKI